MMKDLTSDLCITKDFDVLKLQKVLDAHRIRSQQVNLNEFKETQLKNLILDAQEKTLDYQTTFYMDENMNFDTDKV